MNSLSLIKHDERNLPLDGGYNCRDLGGIINKENQIIRKGLLLRSDDLANLSDNDLERLNNFPIRTIIDFRTVQERATNPDHIPNSCNHEIHLDISSGHFENMMKQFKNGISNPKEFMRELYIDLVINENCQREYKKFFDIVQHKNRTPILFHCTAGKDRTGFASALLLTALNVDKELIMEDYLASNVYLEEKFSHILKINPSYKALIDVLPEYLETAFQTIEKHFDNTEYYLSNILGVDFDLMKELYLEK